MNVSEHLELSPDAREGQIIKWNSTASLTFPVIFFCTFLSNKTLVIAKMLSAREYMSFINEVLSFGQVKANLDLKINK